MKKIKVIKEDLSQYELECGGGYADPKTRRVFIDSTLSKEKQQLITVHEVLELDLTDHINEFVIPHSYLDVIAKDILSSLEQL